MARNVTEADTGSLSGCRYLLRDRDTKFGAAFDGVLASVGIKPTVLPPHSPNLNAHCERWIRSVKTEVLSKMILFGERSLRHCLAQYLFRLCSRICGSEWHFPRPGRRVRYAWRPAATRAKGSKPVAAARLPAADVWISVHLTRCDVPNIT